LPEDFFADLAMGCERAEPETAFPRKAALDTPEELSELLQAAGGNISQLAKQLGVSRNTLYKRLREQGF
ncbi:helix-turn-helix domain-containing protein, partial [Pseudomonas sp.]|uniref:helix-turn-helix domain-containing protein n=1 Tax=Pseudomonas sp. TaxID=306 RepID=UPI002ED9F397